jgi:hypothetical protein
MVTRENMGQWITENKTMLTFISFVYIACDLIAIGTGARVLFGLFTGALPCRRVVLFLRCSLLTSVIGLLSSFPHPLFTQSEVISMLSVYLSAIPILAWRRYHLAGRWRSIFALSIPIIISLNVFVAIKQAFNYTR